MLTAKFWKPDAIVRLLLSVLICIYAGSVILVAAHFLETGNRMNARLICLTVGALILMAVALIQARQPWTLENFIKRVFMVLLFFYAAVFMGAFAQKLAGPLPSTSTPAQTIIATLSIQGAGLVLIAFFVREHDMSWVQAFGLDIAWRDAILYGMLFACIFLPVAWLLQQASYQFMTRVPHFPIHPEEQQAVQTLRHATAWSDRIALGAVTILVAPMAEEMLFRGILYPAIKEAGYPQLALWGTSFVFATIHFTPVIFLPLLLLALLLVGLYEKTGNLAAPITAHSLFNGLNFAMVYILDKHQT